MESALLIVSEKLKETGMSQTEVDSLLARFLEEEAFDYVEIISDIQDSFEQRIKENVVIN